MSPSRVHTDAEPTARFAARVAAAIFGGEALILLAVALLDWSELGAGRMTLPVVCAAIAALLFTLSARASWRALHVAVAVGTVVVSVHAWTVQNEPALSGEMLYVWLGLYAAYFFSPRQAAAQLALMAGAYLGVLLVSVPSRCGAGRLAHARGHPLPRRRGCWRVVRDGVTQLVKRLSEAALTDTLTGLSNRLALGQELARPRWSGRCGEARPLSLVIGDLDRSSP